MKQKITIIGAGAVGAATAFALLTRGEAREIVLIDINTDKALGEALDIRQGVPFCSPANVYAGSYADAKGSDIIVITSGMARKAGQSRLDLTQTNVDIIKSIADRIVPVAPEATYVIVSNPVDILTKVAMKVSGFPENSVIGSGTVLDTARLKYRLSEHLGVDNNSIHAFIIGEHGDSEIAAWSSANISGIPIDDFCQMRGHYSHDEEMDKIGDKVKNSAYEIIKRKQATYYGIAVSIRRICEVILRDEKSILPISNMMHGEYGIDDVVLSMPCVVGRDGIEPPTLGSSIPRSTN